MQYEFPLPLAYSVAPSPTAEMRLFIGMVTGIPLTRHIHLAAPTTHCIKRSLYLWLPWRSGTSGLGALQREHGGVHPGPDESFPSAQHH